MELKDYQKEVLDELNAYFSYLEKYQDLRKAYQEFWEDRGISMSSMATGPSSCKSLKKSRVSQPTEPASIPESAWQEAIDAMEEEMHLPKAEQRGEER